MTAHSSKGLEYDYIFLPFATEESWMRRTRVSSFVFPREKDEGDDTKDARRLFYVAITRAKKHVCIITSAENTTGKILTPLRFIDELQKESVSQKNIPAELEKPEVLKIADLQNGREKEMAEYTKRIILENGLSVTALNHFLNCPSQFFYKSILKIPEAPSATSEKGIAMHKALAVVWREKNKIPESIQKTIEKTVKEYFRSSLLPMFEKEVILTELLESAPKVAVALKDYFNSAGQVFVEKWIEKNFQTQIGKPTQEISFELHGQLDVIIDTGKKVQVFDYKTREAMSENAIKGQTQDADGNYFRQLVFYKMLLQKNPPRQGLGKNIGNINSQNEKQIEPSLIFVKPDAKGRCPIITLPISETDIKNVEEEIGSLVQSVFSGAFLSATCSDPSCKWCKMKLEFL
jgi:DNA helicase-2/ATP-dependent DNA helicase PcrA